VRAYVCAVAILAALSLAAVAVAPPERAEAHVVPVGLGVQVFVKVTPVKVFVEYNVGFSSNAGFDECLKMETSRDDVIQKEEIEAWLDRLKPRLLEGLSVSVDGKRLDLKLSERNVLGLFSGTDVKDPTRSFEFDTWWKFEADVDLGPGEHKVEVREDNFRNEICQTLLYLPKPGTDFRNYYFDPGKLRWFDVGAEWQFYGRQVALFFEFLPKTIADARAARDAPFSAGTGSEAARKYAEESKKAAKEGKTAEPESIGATPGDPSVLRRQELPGWEEEKEVGRLKEIIDDLKKGSLWTWVVGLTGALGLGMIHAMAPGHGKGMVAAYLLGTQGRIRDAVALGIIVTITHTGSIFVIAVGVFYLAERYLGMSKSTGQGLAAFWLEIGSGAIIAVVALVIFILRLQGKLLGHGHHHHFGHDHHHDHPHHHHDGAHHDHDHDHDDHHHHHHHHHHGHGHHHEPGPEHDHGHGHSPGSSPRGLLSIGIASGIAPCTAGLILILWCLANGLAWYGLIVLGAFSLGLGVVLVAIAVAFVTSKSLLKVDVSEKPWVRKLPLISPVILFFLGGWIVYDAIQKNPDVVRYLQGG